MEVFRSHGSPALRRLIDHVHLTLEVFDTRTGRTVFTMPFSEVVTSKPEPVDPIDAQR